MPLLQRVKRKQTLFIYLGRSLFKADYRASPIIMDAVIFVPDSSTTTSPVVIGVVSGREFHGKQGLTFEIKSVRTGEKFDVPAHSVLAVLRLVPVYAIYLYDNSGVKVERTFVKADFDLKLLTKVKNDMAGCSKIPLMSYAIQRLS
ncbi:MAG: hypothetical protein MN733_32995 [Nitrososphaera sp.]|nr:hypothetical protein [Nitrososphaera sp.]